MLARPKLRSDQIRTTHQASGSGPPHRGALAVASGRSNQTIVQQQGSGSNRGRCDKKGLSRGMVTIVDTEDGTIEIIKA